VCGLNVFNVDRTEAIGEFVAPAFDVVTGRFIRAEFQTVKPLGFASEFFLFRMCVPRHHRWPTDSCARLQNPRRPARKNCPIRPFHHFLGP
jgi:hypothetical protein